MCRTAVARRHYLQNTKDVTVYPFYNTNEIKVIDNHECMIYKFSGIPPIAHGDGFSYGLWSLALYNKDGSLHHNDWDIQRVGSSTNVKVKEDGTFELLVQPKQHPAKWTQK